MVIARLKVLSHGHSDHSSGAAPVFERIKWRCKCKLQAINVLSCFIAVCITIILGVTVVIPISMIVMGKILLLLLEHACFKTIFRTHTLVKIYVITDDYVVPYCVCKTNITRACTQSLNSCY